MSNRKEYMKKYCDKHKKQYKKYCEDHKEYLKECRRKYYEKNKEKMLERNKDYYNVNREEIRKRAKIFYKNNTGKVFIQVKKYHNKIVQYVDNYKLSKGCSVCKYNKCASALEFHHNGDKEFSISKFYGNIEKLKIEMDKCIILCANCHRELHTRKKEVI